MDANIGDTVTVRGVVTAVGSDYQRRLIRFKQDGIWVHPEEIATVEPRVVKVGDTVTWEGFGPRKHELIAIHDGRAWIRAKNDSTDNLVTLTALTLVP